MGQKQEQLYSLTSDGGGGDLSRRGFLTGALAVAGAAATTGLVACTAEGTASGAATSDAVDKPWLPAAWDGEADVVVVGYGGAGACAAMAAADADASVIVLEKAPGPEGGNTGVSTGNIHTTLDVDDLEEFIAKIKNGCFGTTPSEATIRAVAGGMQEMRGWLTDHGIELVLFAEARATNQRPSGRTWAPAKADGTNGEGSVLFASLDKAVTGYSNIEIRYSAPAKWLIQDPTTREIVGVQAETNGKTVFIKAKKGVIMACGGYENNPVKQGWYNYPGLRLWPWGTPYNTGDGLDICAAVGTNLWHLHGLEWAAVNFKKPTELTGVSISTDATTNITPYNYIFVNKEGKRFMNDARGMGHDVAHKPVTDFNDSAVEYYNIPFFMVFDDTQFNAGPLYKGTGRANIINTYAGVFKLLDWGPDNTKALNEGWIVKGDSIVELAGKMKAINPNGKEVVVDAAGLEATLAAYNGYVDSGNDVDFSRPADRLFPIIGPPYYAIELGLTTINTQGGPEHNEFCQSMHVDGTPIPRLYNVGEFGSINGFVYVAGNIAEALTTGRIAGSHAAGLTAWDA